MAGRHQYNYGSGAPAGSNPYNTPNARSQQVYNAQAYAPNGYSTQQSSQYQQPSSQRFYTANSPDSQNSQSSEDNYFLVKPWACIFPNCMADACHTTSFSRKADLERHYTRVHGLNQVLYDCLVPGCNRTGEAGLPRHDKLLEHMRDRHGMDLPKMQRGGSRQSQSSQGSQESQRSR